MLRDDLRGITDKGKETLQCGDTESCLIALQRLQQHGEQLQTCVCVCVCMGRGCVCMGRGCVREGGVCERTTILMGHGTAFDT